MKIKLYKTSNWFDNPVLWGILLIPHLKTDYMNDVVFLDRLFNIGRVFSGVMIFMILLFCRRVRIKFVSLLLIAVQGILFISTVVNNLPLKDTILRLVSITCIVLLINFMSERDSRKVLETVLVCMAILVFINFVSILLYPEGLYNIGSERNYYFLGHVNSIIYYVLPALVTALLLWRDGGGRVMKLLCIGVIAIGIITELVVWSATSLVGIAVFILLLVGRRLWENRRVVNVFSAFLAASGTTLLILFFQIQYQFQFFIENILRRSMDFTRRLRMWELTIRYIREKPWMGYGVEDITIRALKIGGPNAHNLFLELLYQGGIAEIIIWLLAMFCLMVELRRDKNSFAYIVISAAIMCVMVMSITESSLGQTTLYLLLSLGVNCGNYADLSQEKMMRDES